MATYFGKKPERPKLIDLVREREIKERAARLLTQKVNVTDELLSRLGLEKELEGHKGCINCLEWSDCGETLASASDDKQIFLWNAFPYKKWCSFDTRHTGNIFSVKFIPKTHKRVIASGAADARVKVFDLTRAQVIFLCTCHVGRVKRLATTESSPSLLWSAAEDGLVVQHDLRSPHNCSTDPKTVLIRLENHAGHNAEAKSLAVNPMRPELIAVGANDAYARLYDRRMFNLGAASGGSLLVLGEDGTEVEQPKKMCLTALPLENTVHFVPGHLRQYFRKDKRSYAATYLTFSSDGTELLVNMGGEHIYLFDILNRRFNKLFDDPGCEMGQRTYGTDPNDTTDYSLINTKVLPDHVEEMKNAGNSKFMLDKFVSAIELYNKALGDCPTAAVLYANRAAALMKRRWDGDVYAALRDCLTTLILDQSHVKAHFRLARCLNDLGRPYEAHRAIKDFGRNFPEYANNSAQRALYQDIVEVMRLVAYPYTNGNRESLKGPTYDYKSRYCGHCNTMTDIKEANFFGREDQYVIAGSDDGKIFIWDRHTTNIVRILRGDGKIVNSLQPHPSSCLIATSGIDSVIRLWSPLPEDQENERRLTNHEEIAMANQVLMNSDPFDLMVMNLGYGSSRGDALGQDVVNADGDPYRLRSPRCITS